MTNEEIKAALASCLQLQQEIDAKTEQLIWRFKELVNALPNETLTVDIQGEIYQLRRRSLHMEDRANITAQTIADMRKYGGAYADYRLVKIGKCL